tara:strand:- start:74 stop:625 length:552 start_codon:yes stop_codon:yes gene_type:complete
MGLINSLFQKIKKSGSGSSELSLKVHNSAVHFINQIDASSHPNITYRNERLIIIAVFLIHIKRDEFYDFNIQKEDVGTSITYFIDDSLDDILESIIFVENDIFNHQRYRLEILDIISNVGKFYISTFIEKRVKNPNADANKIARLTIVEFIDRIGKYLTLEKCRFTISSNGSFKDECVNKPKK